jgi:hypothetical protein
VRALLADPAAMKLAVAASALLLSASTTGWHSVASTEDPQPRTSAAVTKIGIGSVRSLGLRVSVAGHPHVFGTVRCNRGSRLDFYGWNYDVRVNEIHRFDLHIPLPATCSFNAVATVNGKPVLLSMTVYKR